ncbi:MAG: endonuclease MutS2, partial [Cytophagia bacterium]|nr:endonuclease MutS2 [Cytophagia bacterium]
MIYPDNLESKLGFDQIRQRLTNYCLSSAGERLVAAMKFSTKFEFITLQLRQTAEFKAIEERSLDFPARHFVDPETWFAKASIEGNFLDEQDFLQIVNSLTSIQACKNFLIKFQEEFPELNKLATPVGSTQDLQREIVSKIDDAAHVKDNATAELQSIRRKLRDEQSRLRRVADQIFRQAVQEKWVPEGALPTVRDGRVVIPILAEHKRKLKGFIQDESATGQTVFMEPAEMLDTNNEIRDLEHAERREVVRILTALTTRLRLELPTLKTAYAFQAVIDFIRAKAKLARDVEAVLPIVENTPVVEWFNAKHPVLFLSLKGKREVVPLTIKLDSTDRVLLVSGPNAGGKSVCLKTLGLLQYMLQCGLLVPMADHSRMGIFKDIFLDIGDQQSLENDLSTYSSHLKNMHVFLENATDQSMVLMDELGSGTDPNFGGAIAQAILASLLTKKVWGLATTHYYNLKLFADQAEGIKNAAMRFDEEHLQPLYQLEMGKPGSSFALEIARKTGMSAATLKVAESLVGTDLAGFEKLSRTLEQERKENEEKTKQVEKLQVELKQTLAKYQTLSSELESKKKDIIGKAKEEAMTLLKTTNREIEKTIRHIRENKAEKKETLKVRKSLQDLSHNVAKGMQEKSLPKSERMEEGDRVRIMGQQGSGLILSLQGKNAVVQFGELKSTVSLTKLEKVEGAVQKELAVKLRSSGINLYEKQAAFNPSLDVRGKRVEELMP